MTLQRLSSQPLDLVFFLRCFRISSEKKNTNKSNNKMLLRRFVGERLSAYYAQSADAVVGGIHQPIPLSSLWGKWHWLRVYQRLYKENHGQWLTPVELFQPFYSQTIVNYIVDCCDNHESVRRRPVEVLELGGGRGTNARHVMDHLQKIRPDLYEITS